MLKHKIFISFIIFFITISGLNAQDYSSFDKARLIVDANGETLDYFVQNNRTFDSIAIAQKITVSRSFSYFRDISLADTLLKLSSPAARLSLMLNPAYNVPVTNFDVENIIRVKILETAFPIDTLQSMASAGRSDGVIVQLNQPVSDQQTARVAGVQASATGANFSTNLLQATAELLLDRGRQELANSFYTELANKLDSVVALNTMFPNTTKILVSRDPYTLPSLGSAWKGAFELDLQALPENLVRFLEIKLPEEKDKLEVVLAFVKMLEAVKSGEHLYEGINNLYNELPATNTFAVPVRLISLISREMTMSRAIGDQDAGKVWATSSDFRGLGSKGQAVFLGFLIKKIESEGFTVDGVSAENLSVLMSRVASFLGALSKGEDAIDNLKTDGSNVISQFNTLSDAATEIFIDFKSILEEVNIIANADGPEEAVNDLLEKLSGLGDILTVLKEANQAVVAQDYGKLLPLAFELFELMDQKGYDKIKTKFDSIRTEIVKDIKQYNGSGKLDSLINYLNDESNFSFAGISDLNDYVQGIKAEVNKLFSPKLKRKVAAAVYELVSNELDKLKLDVPADFMKIAMFVIEVTQAKTSAEIQGILDAAILPVGSYRMKRQPYSRAVYLQGFAGFTGGYESLNNTGSTQNYDGVFGGLFLPVGFEYTSANRTGGYNGIFLSIIDVGAIGSFSLSEDNADLAVPALTFQNVLSPGLFYTHGVRNAPITWGLGARFAPELRKISVDQNGAMADLNGKTLDSVQFNFFLAVDIPLSRIFKITR